MQLSLTLYILATLVWLGLAAFFVVRIPKCDNVPVGARIFVMVFLIFQIITQAFQLSEILKKKSLIVKTNYKTNVNTHKNTIGEVNNLLMTYTWFYISMIILLVFIYYIIFKSIYTCKNNIIPKEFFWGFIIATAAQISLMSIVKTCTEKDIMMNALST